MSFVFADREDIAVGEKIIVSPNVVRGAVTLLPLSAPELTAALKENYVISCAYWILNITQSTIVTYKITPPASDIRPTAAGQQGVGFIGLAYLMGLVKDPTTENAPACKKRWTAGLAGVSKVNALNDSFMDTIWRFIVDKKHTLYSHTDIRKELMTKYLQMENRENEPAIGKAVLSQLDLVFKDAYLKSVNLMQLFTESGSRALEIPSILDEVMKLDEALTHIKSVEGANYSTCRLIDNNKYPILNHANYPNLYAATLEWARRSRKVQSNYLGSKSLIDQAVNQDIVRRVLKMTTTSIGSGSLTQEQLDWLRTRKGYRVPATPLSELLSSKSSKRHIETSESDQSESDVEEETDRKRRKRTRSRRNH